MMNIPVLLLPVLAFVLAVIVGRLVTIAMDQFREDGAALEKGLSDAATSNQTAV